MVSAVLCEMISFEKAGSEFRRVRFAEQLTAILSVCPYFCICVSLHLSFVFVQSGNRSVRTAAMNAVREMIRKEKRMGEMVGESVGVKRMVERVKIFVEEEKKKEGEGEKKKEGEEEKKEREGEKRGKRRVEREEVCGVLGVMGEMIACGVEIGEEDAVMENVKWLEEEGMKREEEEGEEGEGWRQLGNYATLFVKQMQKKNGRGMTLGRATEEAEKIAKEKEEKKREIEEMQKEKEEAVKREEKMQREKEEALARQKELEEEVIKLKRQLPPPVQRMLDGVRVVLNPDQSSMSRNGNTITHSKDASYTNAFIGDTMTTVSLLSYHLLLSSSFTKGVYHMFVLLSLLSLLLSLVRSLFMEVQVSLCFLLHLLISSSSDAFPALGVVDSSQGYPQHRYVSWDRRGVNMFAGVCLRCFLSPHSPLSSLPSSLLFLPLSLPQLGVCATEDRDCAERMKEYQWETDGRWRWI